MIKNFGGKFDYWISPNIRQILLHWGCELKKKVCYNFLSLKCLLIFFFKCIKDELLSIQQKRNIAKSKEKLS